MNEIKQQLQQQARRLQQQQITTLFANDPERFQRYSLKVGGIFADFSKHRLDDQAFSTLFRLARANGLSDRIQAMFTGEKINSTEKRAVLHTALRDFSATPIRVDGEDIKPAISQVRAQMRRLVEQVHNGEWRGYNHTPITDVVNIGIGGSDLGPKMVTKALQAYHCHKVRCHFLANVDGHAIDAVLAEVNPASTLFIVASKSFSTQETLMNANTARAWLIDHLPDHIDAREAVTRHFVAISSAPQRVREFGIAEANRFEMWDWVGGRYSLWSAIGLPVALAVGMDNFENLLAGAEAMDQHFRDSAFERNLPVILALISLWYSNYCGSRSQAILPYDERLAELPAYLQQADMESNGKSCQLDGNMTTETTGVVLWGGVGTNGQHAFHQLLHQGTLLVPVDFIICRQPGHSHHKHHQALVANCLGQAQALLWGKTRQQAYEELLEAGYPETQAQELAPHKVIPGNKPSTTLVLDKLTPYNLGGLLALYEHKIFVQGAIWQINSFDQWGVELGKALSKPILQQLEADTQPDCCRYDHSTPGLMRLLAS